MHVIAAKAVAFGEALEPEFADYARQVVVNAQALAESLIALGYRLCAGGQTITSCLSICVRVMLNSPAPMQSSGSSLQESSPIRNGIPNDPRPPMVTSGLRLGTAALTTRGLDAEAMHTVATLLDRVMGSQGDPEVCAVVAFRKSPRCATSTRYPTELSSCRNPS